MGKEVRIHMSTSAAYKDFILDQLSDLDGIRVRAMMGEYVLYYRDRIVGGLYDDRLMVKAVPAARTLLPHTVPEPPYPGAKGLLPRGRGRLDERLVCRLLW